MLFRDRQATLTNSRLVNKGPFGTTPGGPFLLYTILYAEVTLGRMKQDTMGQPERSFLGENRGYQGGGKSAEEGTRTTLRLLMNPFLSMTCETGWKYVYLVL